MPSLSLNQGASLLLETQQRVDLTLNTISKDLKTSSKILNALSRAMIDEVYQLDVSTGARDAQDWQKRLENTITFLDRANEIADVQAGPKKYTKYSEFFSELSNTRDVLRIECGTLLRPTDNHELDVRNKGYFLTHFTIAAKDIERLAERAPKARIKTSKTPSAG
jgi:hypothetical protein